MSKLVTFKLKLPTGETVTSKYVTFTGKYFTQVIGEDGHTYVVKTADYQSAEKNNITIKTILKAEKA